jgi:hypothetical protein
MIADPGNRGKRAVFVRQGNCCFPGRDFSQGFFIQLFDASNIRPLFVRHQRPLQHIYDMTEHVLSAPSQNGWFWASVL